MWLWNTETDEFMPGQWIKGRIDEHSTLSPDGRYVVSRVMRGDQHTVLSRPPYFSALAVSVKGLCLNGARFLQDGSLYADFDDWRVSRERCPMRLAEWEEAWGHRIDNKPLFKRRYDQTDIIGQDQRGRTIVLDEGRIGVRELDETHWLIDLNPYEPTNVPPPDWALDW